MTAQPDNIQFVCPAGHVTVAPRARSVNCKSLTEWGDEWCVEEAFPVGTVRHRRVKEAPLWAGFDVFGNPVPANETAHRIVDGEMSANSRRREKRDSA